jgi:hypothetical protein
MPISKRVQWCTNGSFVVSTTSQCSSKTEHPHPRFRTSLRRLPPALSQIPSTTQAYPSRTTRSVDVILRSESNLRCQSPRDPKASGLKVSPQLDRLRFNRLESWYVYFTHFKDLYLRLNHRRNTKKTITGGRKVSTKSGPLYSPLRPRPILPNSEAGPLNTNIHSDPQT